MTPRLVLVLGDQLDPQLSALRAADPTRDIVLMAEVAEEGTHVRHHPQKIALILSAMRHHAAALRAQGWRVVYSRLDDPDNTQSIPGELARRAAETGADCFLAPAPGAWRLRRALVATPLQSCILPDDRFFASETDFAAWAEGRRELRMEWFYREMRRRTGILMDGDRPAGGRWNYDAENRRPARPDLFRPAPPRFAPDAVTEVVLDLVAQRFPDHFGRLRPFGWAVTRQDALQALAHFLGKVLPRFGVEQDAMLVADPWLSHALISPYLNVGLLSPREVCAGAEAEWRAGRAPIEAVEGFIRQILGWREYVRGFWALMGPDYLRSNALGCGRRLPAAYWGGDTRMECLKAVVAQTRELAYAHHIQRLMVTGNFALLAGIDPAEVHEWYLSVYIDALEWVEAPNTLGMSQFADGGRLASKPYAASGAYIARMSDYCDRCTYRVTERAGPQACPFNPLYWHFLERNRDRLGNHPRIAAIYRGWQKKPEPERAAILRTAEAILTRLDAGQNP
ncbi:MAG: cryptochrome/photolyase family protein [Albidovulum sp.]